MLSSSSPITFQRLMVPRAVYMVIGSRLARQVCEYAGGSRCSDLSYIISDGLLLAYVTAAHYSGAIPVASPGKRDVYVSQDYSRLWEIMLSSDDDISRKSRFSSNFPKLSSLG